MLAINNFINRFFGVIMLVASFLGLIIPVPDVNTADAIIISLGVIIFTSFFRVGLNKELVGGEMKPVLFFFTVRFLVLPLAVYFILNPIFPFYALSFFLLLLMPSAVSSPAFALMFNGEVSLALKILVFSSFLSILSIPFISQLVLAQKVNLDSGKMFMTMLYTILVPFVLHIPIRKLGKVRSFLTTNTPLITVLGLIVIYLVAISHNKEVVINNPQRVVLYTLVSLAGLLVFYLLGYFMMFKFDKAKRISYSVCSGANNIGIGVTITAIYFTGEVNVFFIISQLAWIFVLIPMRYFYRWQQG
ncbi:MAG: hypothetical protein JXB49_12505 [Bacteroidales bacterium]|nr:hypothetical protein [Bacteroidales bacterium]